MKTITQMEECRQDQRFKIQGMVIAVARPSYMLVFETGLARRGK